MAGFLTYLSKRLGLMGITLGLVTIITFGFTNVLPGDVALLILGPNADPASVDALRTQLGLDQPLYVQYGQWISQMASGSFGDSLRYGDPVMTLIMERLPRSLMLAGAATIVAVGLAIPLGVIAAINENRWPDFAASVFAFAGISVPGFLWGIFFIYIFGVYFGVLPTGGYVSPREDLIASIKHLLMPAAALGFALTAYIMRMTRSSMVEVFREEYITVAEAKGLRERTVVLKHALRNAIIPVITVIAFQFSYAFGGVVVIEEVFFWPGIGQLTLIAIESRDIPLIQGTVITVALVFMFSNLVADVLYGYFDPRIRYGGEN